MDTVRYCTPEWLESCFQTYSSTPRFAQEIAKLTVSIAFRVTADPSWGIEEDILFGGAVDRGKLLRLGFISEQTAKTESDFVLSASPQEWKKILRKENKFLTDFMLGKITLQQGSKVGVLTIAPHANTFVDVLTQTALQFPDEMSPEEFTIYRRDLRELRHLQGV